MITDARAKGEVRRSIRFALRGLIADRKGELEGFIQPDLPFTLSFMELTALLVSLRRLRKIDPESSAPVAHLLSRVGAEVARKAVEDED